MKKIKFLTLAMIAIVAGMAFTACSSDDNNNNGENISNMERYLREVTSTVEKNKKNEKAILLVAFGSTWQQAFESFDGTKKAYEIDPRFKDYDVYVSFSSAICINRAAAGEHVKDGAEVRNYYAPEFWLEAFGRVKYKEIIVQSLQVIPGEEFDRVVAAMKNFGNNSYGDLDDAYLAELFGDEEEGKPSHVKLGMPLMYDEDEDVPAVAKAINDYYGSKFSDDDAFLLMGHGNPVEFHKNYDTYDANKRYTQLEKELQASTGKNYFVGTVDMPDNYKEDVLDRMSGKEEAKGSTYKFEKVYLAPLMSIAGDHSHNDMADVDDEDSWYSFFGAWSYSVAKNQVYQTGLLDIPGVRAIWMQHSADAEQQYLYHSKGF